VTTFGKPLQPLMVSVGPKGWVVPGDEEKHERRIPPFGS
jgi:hypothetical protein